MARRALAPAQLAVVQAVHASLGPVLHPAAKPPASRLRVAVSGGADSMALLAGTCHVAGRDLVVEAVVVDHGLQSGSAEVARQVAARAQELGAEARVVEVAVEPRGEGLEAAARLARYAALLTDDLPVLLGHTLDDQAEGVLLGLARGSGPASLKGMLPRRGPILRPLLGLRRQTTEQACREWGLQVWQDPMNLDHLYRRVQVRALMPELERVLGPGFAEALARTATLLQHDDDLLGILTQESYQEARRGRALDCVALVHLHPSLRGRVLRRWLVEQGVEQPTMVHVQAVEELVMHWRGQQGVDLPPRRRVRRTEGLLVAQEQAPG